MTKDLYIQDSAEVHFTSLVTGNVVGVGYAQTAGIEGTTEESDIRGGIGNKLAYTIRSSKDIELSVTSATFKPEFFALTQGTEHVENISKDVTKSLTLTVGGEEGALTLTLPEDLNSINTVRVEDVKGVQQDVSATSGQVELPESFEAKVGDSLEVFYLKTVTGRALDFNASKFGGKVKVEYATLCYDRETATVYSDLYFIFPECIPSGDFSMSLENGEAYIPEMTFKVTAPAGSDVLGTKLEEIREDSP